MNGEIEKLLQKEIEAIGNIPIEDTIDRAVELLHEAVM